MREDYRDYHKINHGNGIVEIFDHGQTFGSITAHQLSSVMNAAK